MACALTFPAALFLAHLHPPHTRTHARTQTHSSPLLAAVMACLRKVLSALPPQVQNDLAHKAPSAALRAAIMAALTPA